MTPFSDAEREAVEDLAYKVITTQQSAFVITVPAVLAAVTLFWAQQSGPSSAPVATAIHARERVLLEAHRRGHAIDIQPHASDRPATSTRGGLTQGIAGWLGPLAPAVTLSEDGVTLDYSGAVPSSAQVCRSVLSTYMLCNDA